MALLPVFLDVASLTVDLAGPEGEVAKIGIGMGLGLASTGASAASRDVTGSLLGIAGFVRSPIEVAAKASGVGWSRWIPGVGIALDGYAALHDISETQNTYDECIKEP